MTTSSPEILESQSCQISPAPPPAVEGPAEPASLSPTPLELPQRSAWVEIDLKRLRRNFALIALDKPPGVEVVSVVKDEGYGHGAQAVAEAALAAGASFLALGTLEEAMSLRDRGMRCRMLLLGDRSESELSWCVDYDLTCCVSETATVRKLGELAARAGKRVPVHMKVNTGMNRYGVHWKEAAALAEVVGSTRSLLLEGAMTHFAQSDETDKTFALLQLDRFNAVLDTMAKQGLSPKLRHACNSGGFLDLPPAHFEMVRLGLLPLGVFPSSVCRRLAGIEPVMTVKARIAAIQELAPGDSVGYGMHYTAVSRRRLAVLPIGYGDGFPRVRNQGCALIHGRRAPLIGGVAMDAITVDITDIPSAQIGDEAVLMGRQGAEEILVQEVARLKNSVSYDVLTGWRARLPRIYLHGNAP